MEKECREEKKEESNVESKKRSKERRYEAVGREGTKLWAEEGGLWYGNERCANGTEGLYHHVGEIRNREDKKLEEREEGRKV